MNNNNQKLFIFALIEIVKTKYEKVLIYFKLIFRLTISSSIFKVKIKKTLKVTTPDC